MAAQQVSRSLKKDERVGAYSKTNTKIKTEVPGYLIKLIAPATDAKAAGATLSAILGFHQLNPNDFCSQFNKLSEHNDRVSASTCVKFIKKIKYFL